MLIFLAAAPTLFADDKPAPIEFDFRGNAQRVGLHTLGDDLSLPLGARAWNGNSIGVVESGSVNGLQPPSEIQQMLDAAQEVQSLQAEYEATIAQLIDELKALANRKRSSDRLAKVAELAKCAESLRARLDDKSDQMQLLLGGGSSTHNAHAEGEIEIFGGGTLDDEIFPGGALPKFGR